MSSLGRRELSSKRPEKLLANQNRHCFTQTTDCSTGSCPFSHPISWSGSNAGLWGCFPSVWPDAAEVGRKGWNEQPILLPAIAQAGVTFIRKGKGRAVHAFTLRSLPHCTCRGLLEYKEQGSWSSPSLPGAAQISPRPTGIWWGYDPALTGKVPPPWCYWYPDLSKVSRDTSAFLCNADEPLKAGGMAFSWECTAGLAGALLQTGWESFPLQQ